MIDFNDKIILAPMAGICDLPFRLLCKEQGCDIVYTEMISAKGMYYNNKLDMYFENFIGDRLLIKEKTINRVFELIADLIGLDYE